MSGKLLRWVSLFEIWYNSLSYAESHGGGPGSSAGSASWASAGAVGAPSASEAGREQQAVSYFESQGWSHAQASGIVANLMTESSLSPTAVGDGGSAYGLGQWRPDRQQSAAASALGVPA